MPKVVTSLNALRKTRRLLKSVQVKITLSSSESDASSEGSAEFSHIPVEDVPNLQNLFLGDDSENSNMDELVAQMQNLTQMLDTMRGQQAQQQQLLDALSQRQAQASAAQNNVQHQQPANATVDTLFKIPDPIKAIPRFDGNSKQLSAWLTTAENTLNVFKNLVTDGQFAIFVTAVINKIEGKAKDIICLAGNPQSFDEIKEILTNALGDRQELTYYKSQLWQTRMTENMTVHKYYNRCKEIVQNIKTLAKQKPKYKDNWDAINAFIEEDALAAFLAGLKEPYFGYAQAAGPADMEVAYAFVCKFKSKESTANNMEIPQKHFKKPKEYLQKPKFNESNQQTTNKSEFNNQKAPEPMEVGSVKSKLTLNRKQIINNREISDDEKSSDEEEDIDINFYWGQTTQNKT